MWCCPPPKWNFFIFYVRISFVVVSKGLVLNCNRLVLITSPFLWKENKLRVANFILPRKVQFSHFFLTQHNNNIQKIKIQPKAESFDSVFSMLVSLVTQTLFALKQFPESEGGELTASKHDLYFLSLQNFSISQWNFSFL